MTGKALAMAMLAGWAAADIGRVRLTNGQEFTGEISRHEDGSVQVTVENGSLTFPKEWIARVKITSRRDPTSEKFLKGLAATKRALRAEARKSGVSARSKNYEMLVNKYAKRYNLDPALVKAVIQAESSFHPDAVSRKGAMGLMQLMPQTAKALKVRDPFEPEENIRAGSRYLRYLFDRFGPDLPLVLAGYNAGPNAVKKYGRVPPYAETQTYVRKVQRYHEEFRRARPIYYFVDEEGGVHLSSLPTDRRYKPLTD